MISVREIWAVGSSSSDAGNTLQTVVERWNGKRWSLVPSPNVPGSIYSSLGGIAAKSASEIWAVGSSESPPTYTGRTLIER